MKATEDRDELIFESTGHGLCVNCGFIGINAELELAEGYDGYPCPHDTQTNKRIWDECCQPIFTKAEREELADYMIGLWTKWKEAHKW